LCVSPKENAPRGAGGQAPSISTRLKEAKMEWLVVLSEKTIERRTADEYEREQKRLRRAMEKLAESDDAPEDIRRKAKCAAAHLAQMGF